MAELTVAQKDAEITRLQTELAKKDEELKKKKEEDKSENSKNTGDGGAGPSGPQHTALTLPKQMQVVVWLLQGLCKYNA